MLNEEIREHLERKILPFWMGMADEENGGFFGYMDNSLTVDRMADKGCILNSRILWTFSEAARVLDREKYLPFARQAYQFMSRFEDLEYGGVYWSVSFDGEPVDTTKHPYGQAFAIYGLAA